MRPRSLLIAGTTALLVVVPVVPAFADGPRGWAEVDDETEVEVGARDEELAKVASGGGSESECTWSRVADDEIDDLWWSAGSEVAEGGEIVDPSEYDWYWRSCPDGAGGVTSDPIPVPRGEPPVDPVVLRDEAVDSLTLPTPAIAMNPPDEQVVHVESWLWIEDAIWTTRTESVSAGGVTTTVTASPSRVTWDVGNGDAVTCDGPGTAYDTSRPSEAQATDCSYTYRHSSAGQPGDAYRVTATIEWEVSWSVSGAAGGGQLPALFTSAPVSVPVAEMQALNQ